MNNWIEVFDRRTISCIELLTGVVKGPHPSHNEKRLEQTLKAMTAESQRLERLLQAKEEETREE